LKSKLYLNEEEARYLDWFDFFEFLLSFKIVQQLNEHPYLGSFIWRWETNRFIFKMIQDAAVRQGRYGDAISDFFGGNDGLEETAAKYDSITSQSQRGGFLGGKSSNYTSQLIQLAKQEKEYQTINN
jgi:hypothetical protein